MKIDIKTVIFWLVIVMAASFALGFAVVWITGTTPTISGVPRAAWTTQTETLTVDQGNATSVRAEVQIRVGDLTVSGGSGPLMEGTFTSSGRFGSTNASSLMPDVRYTDDDGQGMLLVCQTALHGPGVQDGAGAAWDLQLDDQLPLDLSVTLGVGRSTLNVGSMNLTDLAIRTGVGETILDLDGVDSNLDVRISGGIGDIAVTVPREVGVLVDAETGIADVKAPGFARTGSRYTNEQYGKTNTTIRIVLDQGIGEVTIRQVA